MDTKQNENRSILWKIHCNSPASKLFHLVSSAEGRSHFWAENAEEENGIIYFVFPNGETIQSRIIEKVQDAQFSLVYFNTRVSFQFSTCEEGGTDILLYNENVPAEIFEETYAGWISVLLALKAYADFGVDLRNHNSQKTWDDLFVDN